LPACWHPGIAVIDHLKPGRITMQAAGPVAAAHASYRMVTPDRSSHWLMSSRNATGAMLLGYARS
jgi:hypothetical protein